MDGVPSRLLAGRCDRVVCVSRTMASQFPERLQSRVGKDVPWIGLYAYGEIGPLGGTNHLHNFTSVVAAIR